MASIRLNCVASRKSGISYVDRVFFFLACAVDWSLRLYLAAFCDLMAAVRIWEWVMLARAGGAVERRRVVRWRRLEVGEVRERHDGQYRAVAIVGGVRCGVDG